MRKILPNPLVMIVLYFVFGGSLFAQKLIQSPQTSSYTYIYKLTNEEAKTFYHKKNWKAESSFFHTLVDSFPTGKPYEGKLPQGHYIRTYADRNKQRVLYTSVPDFDVFILNNNTDLCIQVLDLKGKLLPDARVVVNNKKLRFDSKIQAFTNRKSNLKGVVEVFFNGHTAWYHLNKQLKNSTLKRNTQRVVYGTPLKYAWIPVNFVVYLPVDGVKSIVKGQTFGTINRTKRFFVNTYYRVACLFDDYNCDRFHGREFMDKHDGYMVFNKPKYMPGDTVKFKALIVNRSGRPINKDVKVVMPVNKKNVELATLSPYRKGAYEYEFFLHDSLGLNLDKKYTVFLELKDDKEYISGSFKYEDYELSKTKLVLRVDETDHYKGNSLTLYVKGTDDNDLHLPDARLEVMVKPGKVSRYFDHKVFVPDTLLFLKHCLEPKEETEVVISDSIFPAINFDYEIQVRMLTSDNEAVSQVQKISYYYQRKKLEINVETDSVLVDYHENGIPVKKFVTLLSSDNFGNKTELLKSRTPCRVELNPFFATFIAKTDSLEENLTLSGESSLLQCYSERSRDSVFVVVNNPRNIPFVYNIYKRNTSKGKGYADSLQYRTDASNKQNYFISIRYIWGGRVTEENYRISYNDKQLKVTVLQPKIVYPGQKSRIEVKVSDADGKPVEGVDVTAYSLTKKFGYSAPDLPYLGKERKNKTVINNFNFTDPQGTQSQQMHLDYEAWKLMAGLDSIEYYKFLYPGNSIYRFEYTTPDSLTQFSPFVMADGGIQPIHVIYIDNRPVYFGWSTNYQPYSFPVDSGYHQIKLRTAKHSIVVDSVLINPGKKLVFSLNSTLNQKGVSIESEKQELSAQEQNILHRYIFPYRFNFGHMYAYIEQYDGRIQFLQRDNKYRHSGDLAGPVAGPVTFNMLDSFSTKFIHEPGFQYDFAPGLLKMRSANNNIYPKNLNYLMQDQSLADVTLTKQMLRHQWQGYLDSRRYSKARYRNPYVTLTGAGKILLEITQNNERVNEFPLNLLVFRYDKHDFLRIYPGKTNTIHNLDQGYYRLLFFYSGARYHTVDSLYIKCNGTNYVCLDAPFEFKKDTFSGFVTRLIEDNIFKASSTYQTEEEIKKVQRSYQQNFQYTGVGDIVDGYIFEEGSGEPLPGVTIIVKGTTYGTITDINGYYSLKIPPGFNNLEINYIGFTSQDVIAIPGQKTNIGLYEQILALDEVVVIGYGVQKKNLLTGAVTTVTSHSLLGGMPGADSNLAMALQGEVGGVEIESGSGRDLEIRIRGVGTTKFEGKPLYIINGVVFEGDISELNPQLIQNINILKSSEATAIYGARAANGVVIINTKAGSFKPTTKPGAMGTDYDQMLSEATSDASSIRDNFSDYAFWQPTLRTNKEGKASFEVTFPDDVTSWETFFLAMNGKKQSGQTSDLIKSYKPLMAKLTVPRFLIEGDSTIAIGKVLNYTSDSVKVTTRFGIDKELQYETTRYCTTALIDSLPMVASKDSLSLKYMLEKEDGYFDGEVRNIAVLRKGLEETDGNFFVVDKDTALYLESGQYPTPVTLYARSDVLDILRDEINNLIDYKYGCNEQLASKLKAILAEKQIAETKGQDFNSNNKAERLIRLLIRNQKNDGLWGWWKNSSDNLWASLHVLEALAKAQQMGFSLNVNTKRISEKLVWELEKTVNMDAQIRMLKIARLLKVNVDYTRYISVIDKVKDKSPDFLFKLIELKQLYGLPCATDTIEHYRKETLLGNVYYSINDQEYSLWNNDIQNTLLAYNIIKNDSLSNDGQLLKIRNYLLEQRKTGCWRNTFESVQIIETILPDVLMEKREPEPSVLTISGDVDKIVTQFPFEMKLDQGQKISVEKTGDYPVYLTTWQRYWNPSPVLRTNDFEITTCFDNASNGKLTAGKVTRLIATVKVHKFAEFVMINVPIPGGCSYSNKDVNTRKEVHREYFRNEVAIFCERLVPGEHVFEIELLPRYSGKYALNPAKVELMYFPTFYSNNYLEEVEIK